MTFPYSSYSFYFSSLIIFLITFLFFIGLGGAINAYIKKLIGDSSAIDEGFGNINPFNHIDPIWFLILLTPLKIVIRKSQPFLFRWKDGIKGFYQKIIFIFAPALCHFIIASIILFFSVKIWGALFFNLALKTPINPSIELTKLVKLIFHKSSSKRIILVLFSLYSITSNMFLGIIDFLINITSFILETYISPKYSSIWITILCLIFIMQIFFIFSSAITIFCWKLISFPLIFLA